MKAEAQEKSWKRVRDVIMRTLELVRNGESEKAFATLDSAIAELPEQHRNVLGVLLLRHAAVLANSKGEQDREIKYTQQALPYAKDYSFAAYNLSQLLLKDGQVDLARRYALEAYKLSCESKDESNCDLVKAILEQWPNLATNG